MNILNLTQGLLTARQIADLRGITVQAVYKWQKYKKVPAEHCLAIEKATNGAVTRYNLRPDVFGDECDCKLKDDAALAGGET